MDGKVPDIVETEDAAKQSCIADSVISNAGSSIYSHVDEDSITHLDSVSVNNARDHANANKSVKAKHKRLAGVVKGVHALLRKKYRESPGDFGTIWKKHCQDDSLLIEYADAMHHLATDIWTKHAETRIEWAQKACIDYFHGGGITKALRKDTRRLQFQRADSPVNVVEKKPCNTSMEINHATDKSSRVFVQSETLAIPTNTNILPHPQYHKGSCSCGSSDCVICCRNLSSVGSSVISPTQEISLSFDGEKQEAAGTLSDPEFLFGSMDHGFEEQKEVVYSKYEMRKYNTIPLPFEGLIRLLDVGSCYNPFLVFDEFQPIGIDISPAVDSVYTCDFLHLDTTEPLQLASDSIDTYLNNIRSPVEHLPCQTFHTVIFSLLLEYFPSPYQRWLCCQKAHDLLMVHGLLIIITPDSHHQNRNAPMMKSWKTCIEALGFKRWRYEKMEHLHCMAFRKILRPEDEIRTSYSAGVAGEMPSDMLYIPQDFNDILEEDNHSKYFFGSGTGFDEEFTRDMFCELPECFD